MGMVVLLLLCQTCHAAVSVSPVIIEAVEVQEGQTFEIVCRHQGEEEIPLQLSLALFDQDEMGGVVFLEDTEATKKARALLTLDKEEFWLAPNGEEAVQVRLGGDDFDHLYAVLFVRSSEPGLQIRFAVLFLLTTLARQGEVTVSSFHHQEEALIFILQNTGLSHGLWEGVLHCFDAADRLGEKRSLQSGLVLAGRSRAVEVALPSWVERVEIVSMESGRSR